jgi:hypothetical protein
MRENDLFIAPCADAAWSFGKAAHLQFAAAILVITQAVCALGPKRQRPIIELRVRMQSEEAPMKDILLVLDAFTQWCRLTNLLKSDLGYFYMHPETCAAEIASPNMHFRDAWR